MMNPKLNCPTISMARKSSFSITRRKVSSLSTRGAEADEDAAEAASEPAPSEAAAEISAAEIAEGDSTVSTRSTSECPCACEGSSASAVAVLL